MGNHCQCPLNKKDRTTDISIQRLDSFFNVKKSESTQKDSNLCLSLVPKKNISKIMLIQKQFRFFLKRKIHSYNFINAVNNSSSKEIQIRSSHISDKDKNISIPKSEFDLLLNSFPPFNDDIPLIVLTKTINGVGEYHGEVNAITKERHGRGIQVFPDKSIYKGQWKNDKANGKGKLIKIKGDYFEGEFVNNIMEGFGRYFSNTGSSYIGTWKSNLQDGEGVETWKDGLEYKGEFKQGSRWGKGCLKMPDGSSYEGEFCHNQIHGQGVYKWQCGNSYEGEWKYNKMDGKGKFKFKDGREYFGNYLNDLKDGYGIFTWPKGMIYKGNWKQGKQHGEGNLFIPDSSQENGGSWSKGIWNEGKILKWKET